MTDALHALTLADVLREHARSLPGVTATVCGDHRATWPELQERVTRLADVLHRHGVGRGDRVAWLGQNCHRLLEGLLACAQLGAVFCPANWRWSAEEFAHALGDMSPRVVLWQRDEIGEVIEGARHAASEATWICHDDPDGYEAALAAADPTDREEVIDPASSVLLMYTAAFTGRPRGALLSHRALLHQSLVVALVQRIWLGYTFLNSGPLFHMATFMTTLATFHLGGTNVFVRRADPQEILELIHRERCNGAFLMPPTVQRMGELNADGRYDLSSLVHLRMGVAGFDEHLSPQTTPWLERPGGYGQTEVCGLVTWAAFGGEDITTGRPSPVAQVRIVDPDGREVPPGEVGEIVVRGPLVMDGYLNDPEETARRQRGGWHHTGDLGVRVADGTIRFVGPMTRFIKSGAENIYPAEVEGVLVQHPAVREAAIIGVPDPTWGQSVVAIVALHDGAEVTAEELIEFCRQRIASYKKPKRVEFVDALPRTVHGQVDRDELDRRFGGGGYPGG